MTGKPFVVSLSNHERFLDSLLDFTPIPTFPSPKPKEPRFRAIERRERLT
jgi:hypothetical protein